MKVKIITTFVFLNLFFGRALIAQDGKRILSVESVNFSILTFASIPCEKFDTNFNGRISYRSVTDKDTLAELESFLGKIKYPKKDRGIDVRAKFFFKKNDSTEIVICTSGYYISVNNRLIRDNSKFAAFLRGLTLQK